jgi:hypothetical protein
MIDVIARAAAIPLYRQPGGAFEAPMRRLELLVVGGTHILPLASMFSHYALRTQFIIPSDIPELDREIEMGRAIQMEDSAEGLCYGTGFARDLSGVNSDSLDILIVSSIYPSTRDAFLAHAWRVVKEFGKVIVFSQSEIPLTHLASFGIAATTYYPVEGFYCGTMRKVSAVRARN